MIDSLTVEQQGRLSSVLSRISVVLVKTTHGGNIGAVARACKTMGISDLRLVSPEAEIDHETVRRASGADDVLLAAGEYSDLQEAVSDCHWVLGASARSRRMHWPIAAPRESAESLVQDVIGRLEAQDDDFRVALVFGQEASGLSNEELQMCNQHVCIPSNADYGSLNLAMAVQVITYEVRMAALGQVLEAGPGQQEDEWDEPIASQGEVEGMIGHLEKALISLGYHDPDNPRMLIPRLRRLFMRRQMDKMEVNILRGMCKTILNK